MPEELLISTPDPHFTSGFFFLFEPGISAPSVGSHLSRSEGIRSAGMPGGCLAPALPPGTPGHGGGGAAGSPAGWAMSNQRGGQGALWTERDKRPSVRAGLLIDRPGLGSPRREDGAGVRSLARPLARCLRLERVPQPRASAPWRPAPGSGLPSRPRSRSRLTWGPSRSDSLGPASRRAPHAGDAAPGRRAREPGMSPRERRGCRQHDAPPTRGGAFPIHAP